MTWTLVEAVLPTLGWQEYSPESRRLDCCTNRNDEVVEPEKKIFLKYFQFLFWFPLNPASPLNLHLYSAKRGNFTFPH